ncbi:acetylxylan esterase [Runella sp. MFBS21]|uniref:alpha/beta hydrolase family protein n=1 Tax=Runella sp. MFBS21 TaxID=3034018 RepID=UPI0023F74179|nr:acetylxylan esterase [Runella sp. MFBS21]MDF7820681.1 acetylxylan esterase [Runella sp. MFBS21]
MKLKSFTILTGILLFLTTVSQAQDELAVLPYWKYYGAQPMALYHHLCDQAFAQLNQRKKAVQALKNPQDWQKRQAFVRQKLQEAVGAFPEKTPLNPVITGKIERNGITVEKFYFESMPNYFVTAALFLPARERKNLPAIVFCSGHGATAFRTSVYQQMILNYVQKGFAVLAFDPIGQGERIQYAKTNEPKRFGNLKPTLEHSYPGAQSFVAGISPAMYFIWDGIRAVDYLLTRPEIDAKRIGITGRSGGGTQSAYIAAMDSRIAVAAPECYLTTYDKLLKSNGPQDAEQILAGMLAKGLDLGDLVEVRAPRPTLMVTTTRDMFSIDGARELYDEAKKSFKAFGAEVNLDKVEDDAPHASTPKNREATYAFFQKHLQNPGSHIDEKIVPFTEEELKITPTGNVYTSLKGETLFTLTQKRVNDSKPKINPKNLSQQLILLTGYTAPMLEEVVFSGKFPKEGYDLEKYLVKGPGAYYLPVLWLRPHAQSNKTVLYISSKGKADIAKKNGQGEQLAQAGYHVVVPDLSGAGELANGYLSGGDSYIDSTSLNLWYMGILTKKSLVAIRMEEIQLITEFIKTKVPNTRMSGVGVGTFVPDLLHAAMMIPSLSRVALVNGLGTYRSLTEHEQYLPRYIPSVVSGAISTYDLPDLVAALSPRQVLISGVLNGAGQPLTASEQEKGYPSGAKHLRLSPNNEILLEWIKQDN